MRLVIQRVSEASVTVDGLTVGAIGRGLMVLVGVSADDTAADAEWLAAKTAAMRIFDDHDGVMNLPLAEVGGRVLAVSQFTLHASTRRGNRPSYIAAAPGPVAEPLYMAYIANLERITGNHVERGIFGADMKVALVNDGPVTIIIDSKSRE